MADLSRRFVDRHCQEKRECDSADTARERPGKNNHPQRLFRPDGFELGSGFPKLVRVQRRIGRRPLLHIDFDGKAQPIWRQPQITSFWGVSSPDARHLAISGESRDTSVWMFGDL